MMKFLSATKTQLTIVLIWSSSAALQEIQGLSLQPKPSSRSTFMGNKTPSLQCNGCGCSRSMLTMYEPSFDPPDKASAQKKLKAGFWVALDHTEKWISETLSNASQENPHARKEVTYECELNQKVLGTIAGIFRRYKEARQLAQKYEYYEKQKHDEYKTHMGADNIFKRTQVMIMPFCEYFDDFESFERVMQAIHQARKNGLDFITDLSIESLERKTKSVVSDHEWSIAVNGASLHPDYQTPKEILDQMELQGLLDTAENRQKLERRNRARKSPYPTLIIEVKAGPPSEDLSPNRNDKNNKVELVGALDDVVKRLESIYAMSAALHKRGKDNSEDIFFNAIGTVSGIEEVAPVNAMELTHAWIQENDPHYNQSLSTFTSSDLQHIDSAYEFVFLNLSLHDYVPFQASSPKVKPGTRSYLVLPKFISSSATSFEKFASDIESIIQTIAGLDRRVSISSMHPESIDSDKRSPHPVIIIQWFDEVKV